MVSSEGVVISCHTLDQWNEQFQKHENSKKLVVVDFTASWCAPCRMIAPIFAEFARKMPNVAFLKVDVDELEAVAKQYQVEAMPTFIFIKGGEILDKVVGARKDDLYACFVKHAGAPATASA